MGNNGGIASIQHSIGKIGDTDTVMVDFDSNELMKKIYSMSTTPDAWIGTHCWPGTLPLDQFEQVLIITTTTFKSKRSEEHTSELQSH